MTTFFYTTSTTPNVMLRLIFNKIEEHKSDEKEMKDKIDEIINRRLKPKPQYYISPLSLKIAILIILLVVALGIFELV
jgi:hypothetical protein